MMLYDVVVPVENCSSNDIVVGKERESIAVVCDLLAVNAPSYRVTDDWCNKRAGRTGNNRSSTPYTVLYEYEYEYEYKYYIKVLLIY